LLNNPRIDPDVYPLRPSVPDVMTCFSIS